MLEKIGPSNDVALLRFGGGSDDDARLFLRALYAFLADKNPNTRRSYGTAVRQFFEAYGWPCPRDVDAAMIADYKLQLQQSGRSDATVYQRLSALSAFFEFLRRPQSATIGGLVAHNPVRSISRADVVPHGVVEAMRWETQWARRDIRDVARGVPSKAMRSR